jgi:hypothetical protein
MNNKENTEKSYFSQKLTNSLKIRKGEIFKNDEEIENFFKITESPKNFDESIERVKEFIKMHKNKKIAFVTVKSNKFFFFFVCFFF